MSRWVEVEEYVCGGVKSGGARTNITTKIYVYYLDFKVNKTHINFISNNLFLHEFNFN